MSAETSYEDLEREQALAAALARRDQHVRQHQRHEIADAIEAGIEEVPEAKRNAVVEEAMRGLVNFLRAS